MLNAHIVFIAIKCSIPIYTSRFTIWTCVNDVTEEDVENYKYTLDTLTENFEGNKEKLYNDLTDGIKKMEAVKGTDDFDQHTYDNMQSWLKYF